jgi:uncharacterized protein (DUF1501 family)
MNQFNVITRRSFLDHSLKLGLGVALSTLLDIPPVVRRALAEGNIGLNNKKLLFIFLRGANDALNSVIPIQDPAYQPNRPNLYIPKDPGLDYSGLSLFDPTQFLDAAGTARSADSPTFNFDKAIPVGNGFAALHPSLKFLAPVIAAGDLALIHRVGYPKQSRSHFDSQDYWENGMPNNKVVKDGILYRTIVESGRASVNELTAVSIQGSLPLLLRGSSIPMTNLTDPLRYDLLGIPNTSAGNIKASRMLAESDAMPYADKQSRMLLDLQYSNLQKTLSRFAAIKFDEANNTFKDDINTDGDAPYHLFPTDDGNTKNGGYALHGNSSSKYVVDASSSSRSFFKNLKAAALILNKTDAIVTGTEFSGFDTHNNQRDGTGPHSGSHANLMRRLGWAIYSLRKYFMLYGKGGPLADSTATTSWNDVVVVTLSEFGRTSIQNGSMGTDHAEAGVMFVAGGGVNGGIYGCNPSDSIPWVVGPNSTTGLYGSMFGVSSRYLKRCHDFRSILGELIRDHLGATQAQLSRIIPGYADSREKLQAGGTSTIDGTPIAGEVGLI